MTENKTVFPTEKLLRRSFYLAHRDIAQKWTMPLTNWAKLLNQLVIFFVGRISQCAISRSLCSGS
jgi:putative transposase